MRVLLKIIQKSYKKLIFQNATDQKTINFALGLPLKANELIVSSGVDTNRFFARDSMMSVNSQKTVIMIGRVAEKGFDDFAQLLINSD